MEMSPYYSEMNICLDVVKLLQASHLSEISIEFQRWPTGFQLQYAPCWIFSRQLDTARPRDSESPAQV